MYCELMHALRQCVDVSMISMLDSLDSLFSLALDVMVHSTDKHVVPGACVYASLSPRKQIQRRPESYETLPAPYITLTCPYLDFNLISAPWDTSSSAAFCAPILSHQWRERQSMSLFEMHRHAKHRLTQDYRRTPNDVHALLRDAKARIQRCRGN